MSTLLMQPPVVRPSRPAPASDRVAPVAASSSASAVAPLSEQLAHLLRNAGLAKADIFILITVYGIVVLLILVGTLAGRYGHPDAFRWGAQLMNIPLAALGLGLLSLATVAASMALYFSGRSRRGATVVGLGLAILGCVGFIATVAADLDAKRHYGICPAAAFKPNDRYVARQHGVKLPKGNLVKQADNPIVEIPPIVLRTVDSASGRKLFLGTCASCHGYGGEGLPGQGKSLATSEFVAQRDDVAMMEFVKVGRQTWDPLNTTKVQMPPKGGNPRLNDDDLRDIIAYLRTLQAAAPRGAAAASAASAAQSPGARAPASASSIPGPIDVSLLLPAWFIPSPPDGPPGLSDEFLRSAARPNWKPPTDGVAFANSFYFGTELGAMHAGLVALGLALLCAQALRGRIAAERRAPLALGVIACAVMTASWYIAFPFLYLF
jgi:mono/diheme cytochrome c family protein